MLENIKSHLEVRDLHYDSSTDPLGSLLVLHCGEIDYSGIEELEARMKHEAVTSIGKRAINYLFFN